MSELQYIHRRIRYPDDTWADAHILHLPGDSLEFMDFHTQGKQARLVDMCKLRLLKALRRDEQNPVIIIYEAPLRGPVHTQFLGVETVTHNGEYLIDTVSFVNYTVQQVLRHGWARLEYNADTDAFSLLPVMNAIPAAMRRNVQTVWDWLMRENRLYVYAPSKTAHLPIPFDVSRNLAGIAQFDFARDFVNATHHPLVFNTAFFLLETDDHISFHSRLGESYGLLVEAGEIIRPPLYNRGALLYEAGWFADRVGMGDLILQMPDETRFALGHDVLINPTTPTNRALYTRLYGAVDPNTLLGQTPPASDHMEFTIIDRHIVGMKKGGGLLIPQNGFVLSFSPGTLSTAQWDHWLANPSIQYDWQIPHNIRAAIQGAPLLMKDGAIVLNDQTFQDEDFWLSLDHSTPIPSPVVPTYFPCDVDQTRAARIGMGVTQTGDIVVVAVDGVNSHARTERDSYGATLVELATVLQEAGAVDAINLDGGGSTQVFFQGGQVTRASARNTAPNILYERMVPSIGLVRASAISGYKS